MHFVFFHDANFECVAVKFFKLSDRIGQFFNESVEENTLNRDEISYRLYINIIIRRGGDWMGRGDVCMDKVRG